MYTWKLWDKASPINGVNAVDVVQSLGNPTEVYLINEDDKTVLIQTDKDRPYKDLPLEECAQRQVDELNYSQQLSDYTMQVYTGVTLIEAVPVEFKQGVLDGVKAIIDGLNPTNESEKMGEQINLLEQQKNALSDRQDFVEDCVAEMAMNVYG